MTDARTYQRNCIEHNFTYHPPRDEDDVEKYTTIRKKGKEFALHIHCMCPLSRELSLALTKIEEAVMWANAAIARQKGDDNETVRR